MQSQTKVFISYSHADSDLADEICNELDRLGIPKFRDVKDIDWGEQIREKVKIGIQSCSHLLVIISPASVKSQWVLYEISIAEDRGLIILPFLAHVSEEPPHFIKGLAYKTDLTDVKRYFQKFSARPVPELAERLGLPTLILSCDTRNPDYGGGWRYRSRGDCDILCTVQPKVEVRADIVAFIDRVWERVVKLKPTAFHTTTLFKVLKYWLPREQEEQSHRTQVWLELAPTDYKEFKGLNDVWGFDGGRFAQAAYDLGVLQAECRDLSDLQSSMLSNPLSVGCMVITRDSQNQEYFGIARRNIEQTATSFDPYEWYVPCGGFVSRTPVKFDAESLADPPSPFHTAVREFGEEVGTFDGINSPVRPEDVTFFALGRDMAANFEIGLCGEINCPFPHEELLNLRSGIDREVETRPQRRSPDIDWGVPLNPHALACWMKKKEAKANSWVPFGWTEVVLTLVRRFGVEDVAKELGPFITAENRHLRMDHDPEWADESPPRPDPLRRLQAQ